MGHSFFAMYGRMKYINRWALMRNTRNENISEHSADVAAIAHALAVIGNIRLGKNLNAEKAALFGLYHDMPEILTGDMPTPVKYYSEQMIEAYAQVEENASRKLLSMLPEDMRAYYEAAFFKQDEDEYLWKLVKAADKISALIKCIEEESAGNTEFRTAYISTRKSIGKMEKEMPELSDFIRDFLASYGSTLDELLSRV